MFQVLTTTFAMDFDISEYCQQIIHPLDNNECKFLGKLLSPILWRKIYIGRESVGLGTVIYFHSAVNVY